MAVNSIIPLRGSWQAIHAIQLYYCEWNIIMLFITLVVDVVNFPNSTDISLRVWVMLLFSSVTSTWLFEYRGGMEQVGWVPIIDFYKYENIGWCFRKSRLARNFFHDSSFALFTTRLKLDLAFLSSRRFLIQITRLYFLRLLNFCFACSQLTFNHLRPFMFVGANSFWHCTVCNLKNFNLQNAYTVTPTYTMAYNFVYVSLSALHSIFILFFYSS